jgi:uncharacterized protein YyaL (SSP411 family)
MAAHSTPHRPSLPSAAELAALPPDGGKGWNRLVFESSPYLLQHAANPVDWFPWGEEAFARARELDRPVFLSIGYATCHWCHVMEHESFEDPEVARLMNETFVNIKVDREERPDIDSVYMTVTQALTGHGGWPMTVLMTPDRRPFFAGTYFPRQSRHGRPGMLELVPRIAALWRSERARLIEAAETITDQLRRLVRAYPGQAIGPKVFELAHEQLAERFDPYHGGFSERPKFPVPHNLSFLLRHWQRTGRPEALSMVEKTLLEMRLGGIFDHVGLGFHRYSTDERWLVPHFEKMLYDQALMVIALVDAYQATGHECYRRWAGEVIEYVTRDMQAPEGGFYSAEDADAEGEEGKFTVWTLGELAEVLGAEDAALYATVYQFEPEGNFAEEATGRRTGANIPHLREPLAQTAARRGMATEVLEARLEDMRRRLFAARERRVHPLKDDKVLTDWNGLMLAALGRAARAFHSPELAATARRGADFLLSALRRPDGRLVKRWRRGQAGLPAHLEDYAFAAWGLLEVYEATLEGGYLEAAVELVTTMIDLFHDPAEGGFFQVARDGESLLVRNKDFYDGAIPSGNSAAALVLVRLGRALGRPAWEQLAAGTIEAFAGRVSVGPANHTLMLAAADWLVGPSTEVVLAGTPGAEDFEALRAVVDGLYLPRAVVLATGPEVARLAPFTAGMGPVEGRAAAYVCQNQTCGRPVTDPAALRAMLEGGRAGG